MSGVDGAGGRAGPRGDVFEALKSGRIRGEDARLRAATRLLESSFYQEMFKAMRDTVPEGGALSGGQGQEMFESMLDQHVADTSAMRSDQGVGQALYRYFTRSAGAAGGE